MLIEGTIPREVSHNFNTDNPAKAIIWFKEVYGDTVAVTSVDGLRVVGNCDDCDRLILGDKKHGFNYLNNTIVCLECWNKQKAEDKALRHIVFVVAENP